MTDDLDAAVDEFLTEADTVFDEYEQGYMDADSAVSRLDAAITELRRAADEE
jgi:hypothetical protein